MVKSESLLVNEKKLVQLVADYEKLLQEASALRERTGSQQASLFKRLAELEPIVKTYQEACQSFQHYLDYQTMLESEKDPELRRLIEEEQEKVRKHYLKLKEKLRSYLFPEDPTNEKNALVEIRQGTGGEEACLFARDLFRMYCRYCQGQGYQIEIFNSHLSERGGFKEIIFLVKGKGAYGRLKFESGVHRVQRIPETESSGRIHTSAATVAVFPEVEEGEIFIDPKDLKIDTFCASGAGGQHVNKTASAVRVTHRPTGIVITCQDERSQLQNRSRALKILRARLQHLKEMEQKQRLDAERKLQVKTGDRSEKIRTYNFPQNRLTDHRIGVTLYQLDRILDGQLDQLIDYWQQKEAK
ncbi:MAG: peptide chain release factor 1 [Candidatus Omnitrophica bacterium]|nr:peptide chain release factor 1 [Candidatus Omnitrophota bacterium]